MPQGQKPLCLIHFTRVHEETKGREHADTSTSIERKASGWEWEAALTGYAIDFELGTKEGNVGMPSWSS